MANQLEAKMNNLQKSFSVSSAQLFVIGLSAGTISAVFPRLMTMLVTSDSAVMPMLFSLGFLIAGGAFAIIIGVTMIWLYMGTTESTRNLFMAALAIPAVLSGGINMSNATAAGQKNLSELAAQNNELTRKLQTTYSIPVVPSVNLSRPGASPSSSFQVPQIFQVKSAYAGDEQPSEENRLNPGVTFRMKEQHPEYVILFDSSTDRAEIEEKKSRLQEESIRDVQIGTSGDTHYLYQKSPQSKSQAVLQAVELKEKHPDLSPKLMKLEDGGRE